MNHFSKSTLNKLAKAGIKVLGTTIIPDHSSDMPFANGDTGYSVNDNGTGRIWTLTQVLAKAGF